MEHSAHWSDPAFIPIFVDVEQVTLRPGYELQTCFGVVKEWEGESKSLKHQLYFKEMSSSFSF